jgi:hypothetical protein
MLNVSIQMDDGAKRLIEKLGKLKTGIPRAAADALNETGHDVMLTLREQMSKDFDRPVPYTLSSLGWSKATPAKLITTIEPREWPGKGTPAKKYLHPEIYGGDRHLKRFEVALQRMGVLPKGMYAYPGAGAKMDAYGNMSTGQIVQIMSYFSAFGEQGYKANITAKGIAKLKKGGKKQGFGFEYFAVKKRHGGLVPGIWKRTSFGASGKAVSPVLIFGKKPTYKRKYQWNEVALKRARQVWPEWFSYFLKRA